MIQMTDRYLYLTRHGETVPDESELSADGRRQATLLGARLREVPLAAVHDGPLSRTTQTARRICDGLRGVATQATEIAGDYVPYLPRRDELPTESADVTLGFLKQFPADQHERGRSLAREALELFTGPVIGSEPRHELVVTHNFLIGWLVRAAQDAPEWRWLGLNHCHAALTVIRYAPGRPSSVLVYNDMGHLPPQLRWTGFSPELRVG